MGIEAFCPNGHRVKVKDHLAGRVGLCPICNTRFRVPDAAAAVSATRPPASAEPSLPTARLLELDPAVVLQLPLAIPRGGDAAARVAVPLGQLAAAQPAGMQSPSTLPPAVSFPSPQLPPSFPPPAWSAPNLGLPPGSPPGEPTVESPDDIGEIPIVRGSSVRRTPRQADSGGLMASLALLVLVAVAAGVAWFILKKQGIVP